MKIIKISFLVTLFLIFTTGQTLFAFGPNGHRIVAKIAELHLSDKTKKEIKKILPKGETLDQIATWPDFIRSEPEWDAAKPWHFITIDVNTTVDAVLEKSGKHKGIDNVVEAIDFFSQLLRGGNAQNKQFADFLKKENKNNSNKLKLYQNSTKATALSFLVHFVGDIHQPLHVGRAEDRGGNSINVLWFDKDSNLHSVWDEGLIKSEKLSYTEMAAFINQDANYVKGGKIKDNKIWTKESVELRHKAYLGIYTKTDKESGKPDLSYDYAHDFSPALQKRMLLGGLRLANLLNDIFK